MRGAGTPGSGEVRAAAAVLPPPSLPAAVRAPPLAVSEPSEVARAAEPDPASLKAGAAASEQERQHAAIMLARGERNLENGSVSVARQFFLRAAEAGVARAALLLASTYDEHEFARLRIEGVQPNATMARKWYKLAGELGATDATQRLRRLGAVD